MITTKSIGESQLRSRPKIPLHLKLKERAVTTGKLADGAVTNEKIADGAIEGRHIQKGAITADKIGQGSLPSVDSIYNIFFPWLDVDEEGNIIALYSDDGAIKDIGMDETADGYEIWVLLTDGDAAKEEKDGWKEADYFYNRRVMVSEDLTGETCPVDLIDGAECTVVYENATKDVEFTISVSSDYKTPNGTDVIAKVPKGGYAEVSYLKVGGAIYVRGI